LGRRDAADPSMAVRGQPRGTLLWLTRLGTSEALDDTPTNRVLT
jgi:hypothetical protein